MPSIPPGGLTPQQAKQMGISTAEMKAYNQALRTHNEKKLVAILSKIISSALTSGNETQKVYKDVLHLINSLRAALTPLAKIAPQLTAFMNDIKNVMMAFQQLQVGPLSAEVLAKFEKGLENLHNLYDGKSLKLTKKELAMMQKILKPFLTNLITGFKTFANSCPHNKQGGWNLPNGSFVSYTPNPIKVIGTWAADILKTGSCPTYSTDQLRTAFSLMASPVGENSTGTMWQGYPTAGAAAAHMTGWLNITAGMVSGEAQDQMAILNFDLKKMAALLNMLGQIIKIMGSTKGKITGRGSG